MKSSLMLFAFLFASKAAWAQYPSEFEFWKSMNYSFSGASEYNYGIEDPGVHDYFYSDDLNVVRNLHKGDSNYFVDVRNEGWGSLAKVVATAKTSNIESLAAANAALSSRVNLEIHVPEGYSHAVFSYVNTWDYKSTTTGDGGIFLASNHLFQYAHTDATGQQQFLEGSYAHLPVALSSGSNGVQMQAVIKILVRLV